MPIYKIIEGKKIKKIDQKNVLKNEKDLQSLISNNLDAFFEMTLIANEYSTTHGGRIDTLAIDKDRRPVIIEYKIDKSSTILLQGLYYMDWIGKNKAEFEKVVRNKLRKEIKINWENGIRLVLIAKSFEIWDKFAVNRIKEEVELYEYALYESNEIKLDKATLPKDFEGGGKTSITKTRAYSIEDQLNKIKNKKALEAVNELREKVKSISDTIEERATKDLIVFKSTINFAQIYCQNKQYWFDIRLSRKVVK